MGGVKSGKMSLLCLHYLYFTSFPCGLNVETLACLAGQDHPSYILCHLMLCRKLR